MSKTITCDFCKNKFTWGEGMKYTCLHFFCEGCNLYSILNSISALNTSNLTKSNRMSNSNDKKTSIFNCKKQHNTYSHYRRENSNNSNKLNQSSKSLKDTSSLLVAVVEEERGTNKTTINNLQTTNISPIKPSLNTINNHNIISTTTNNTSQLYFYSNEIFNCLICKKGKSPLNINDFLSKSATRSSLLSNSQKTVVDDLICQSCNKNYPENFCKECKIYMCHSCLSNYHSKIKAFLYHIIVDNVKDLSIYNCLNCSRKNSYFFCCNNYFCILCILLWHQDHEKIKYIKQKTSTKNKYTTKLLTQIISASENIKKKRTLRKPSIKLENFMTRVNQMIKECNPPQFLNEVKNNTNAIEVKLKSTEKLPSNFENSTLKILRLLVDEKKYYLDNYSKKSNSFHYFTMLKNYILKVKHHLEVAKRLSPDQIKDGSNDILMKLEDKEDQITRLLINDFKFLALLIASKKNDDIGIGNGNGVGGNNGNYNSLNNSMTNNIAHIKSNGKLKKKNKKKDTHKIDFCSDQFKLYKILEFNNMNLYRDYNSFNGFCFNMNSGVDYYCWYVDNTVELLELGSEIFEDGNSIGVNAEYNEVENNYQLICSENINCNGEMTNINRNSSINRNNMNMNKNKNYVEEFCEDRTFRNSYYNNVSNNNRSSLVGLDNSNYNNNNKYSHNPNSNNSILENNLYDSIYNNTIYNKEKNKENKKNSQIDLSLIDKIDNNFFIEIGKESTINNNKSNNQPNNKTSSTSKISNIKKSSINNNHGNRSRSRNKDRKYYTHENNQDNNNNNQDNFSTRKKLRKYNSSNLNKSLNFSQSSNINALNDFNLSINLSNNFFE